MVVQGDDLEDVGIGFELASRPRELGVAERAVLVTAWADRVQPEHEQAVCTVYGLGVAEDGPPECERPDQAADGVRDVVVARHREEGALEAS